MKLDDMDVRETTGAPPQPMVRPSGPVRGAAPQHGSRWWVWLIILLVVGGLSYLVFIRIRQAQSQAAASARSAPRSFPVVAAIARRGDMPMYLNGLGTVTAFETVTVRSRVDGELMHVRFKEGQLVHAGDVLAEIDPRPFQVQLEQAEGQLARDQAQLQNAQADLQRFLSIKESITPQQIDTQRAMIAQLQGAIKSDQAQIDNAKLQLAYCRITAPLDGRVGLRMVDEGNIIHASDAQGLVVITQLQPIAVNFFLREDDIADVLKRLSAGEQLAVDALEHDAKTRTASGTLLASDNQVDSSTGTLRFKAIFGNENGALFPNQFVNARLLLTTLKEVVIVPAAAVQRGPQQATFVYVVQSDPAAAAATRPATGMPPTTQPQEQIVELRNVTVGHPEGDDIVIENGIAPGEIVVTDGVDKLQQGTKVTVKLQRPPAVAPSTQPVRGRGAASRPADAGRSGRPGGRSGRRGEE